MRFNSSGYSLIEALTGIAITSIFIAFIAYVIAGCCQLAARNYGGTMTYELEPNKHLVNCTWKENQLWLLTEDREVNVVPKTYYFIEKSVSGILQGTVVIKEK